MFAKCTVCVDLEYRFQYCFRLGPVSGSRVSVLICNFIVKHLQILDANCNFYVAAFVFADDILLLAPSVIALQLIVTLCQTDINLID